MDENFKLYDRIQKQILKRKPVIALIISISFYEFSGMSTKDIADIIINNESNQPILLGEESEINLLDRQVRFDSLFKINFPDGRIGYVNIEIQNMVKKIENLIGRSFTYDGVLVATQIGIEIVDQHYENLKKTASIWLISDAPAKYEGNAIRCFIEQENIIGEVKFNHKLIDFFNTVYIFLTKDDKIKSEKLKILSALLNPYMDHQVREEILKDKEEYSILRQEVFEMEGNGRAIYDKGTEYGIGIGETNKALAFIKVLLEDHYDFNQIAKMLHLSEEEQIKYRTLLNQR